MTRSALRGNGAGTALTTTSTTANGRVAAGPDTGAGNAAGSTAGKAGRDGPRPGLLLATILTGQFMALLDVFIVNVAAPTMRGDLHASGGALQLIIAGYSISYAVLLITGARLGGLLGHRRLFVAGVAVFTGASLACGLAQGTGELIGFRFVQGAGSALMIPQVLSLLQLNFRGEARTRAMSVYTAVLSSGAALGQTIGGVLVSADVFGAGWRPVFLVNVPIGLLMLAVVPRVLPADGPVDGGWRRVLDLPGLVVLAAAVTLVTVPLVLGQEEGWPVWGWVCLGLSAALFWLFAVIEARLSRRGGAPLVTPRVLRAPGMLRAALVIVATMGANAGFLFAVALHLQSGLGFSPTLTQALATVAPQDAPDASGFLATVTQLGQLIGVATLGTLFLNQLHGPGVHASAHAFAVASAAMAAVCAAGAVAGVRGGSRAV